MSSADITELINIALFLTFTAVLYGLSRFR